MGESGQVETLKSPINAVMQDLFSSDSAPPPPSRKQNPVTELTMGVCVCLAGR